MYSWLAKRKSVLWIFMVLVIGLSVACVRVSRAQGSGITLEVQPDTCTATQLGETFDIDVTINDLDANSRLVAVEFKLRYNTTMLSVVNVTEGPFMKDPSWAFNGTIFMGPIFGDDYVLVGILLMPHIIMPTRANWTAFPEGSGTLATITFNATQGAPSSCVLQLDDTKLSDDNAEPISHSAQDGYYEFVETLYHGILWDTVLYYVTTESNSRVSPVPMDFDQPHRLLSFNVIGLDGTNGFCNVTIPKELLDAIDPNLWLIIVDGLEKSYIVSENLTHTSLYFTYGFPPSTHTVQIIGTEVIPEFPATMIPLSFLAVALVAIALRKAAWSKKRVQ